jgi:hypothetical protein
VSQEQNKRGCGLIVLSGAKNRTKGEAGYHCRVGGDGEQNEMGCGLKGLSGKRTEPEERWAGSIGWPEEHNWRECGLTLTLSSGIRNRTRGKLG